MVKAKGNILYTPVDFSSYEKSWHNICGISSKGVKTKWHTSLNEHTEYDGR